MYKPEPPKRSFYPQRFAVFIALPAYCTVFPHHLLFYYISVLKIPKTGFF